MDDEIMRYLQEKTLEQAEQYRRFQPQESQFCIMRLREVGTLITSFNIPADNLLV